MNEHVCKTCLKCKGCIYECEHMMRTTITGTNSDTPYDPKTYRPLSAKDQILYNPNLVSQRKHVLIGGPAPKGSDLQSVGSDTTTETAEAQKERGNKL